MASLSSVEDREAWAEAFSAAAAPHEHTADAAVDPALAKREWLAAYGLYRMARFPCMNSTGKKAAYLKSQACFARAHGDSIEHVQMGGSPGLLRMPSGALRAPVLIAWGGIDTFKEDRLASTDPFLARGIATLTIDMPGTADAPVPGSTTAESMWDAILDWVASEPRLDETRVALWGGSTGGYWATKLAHTHRHRLAAVISQGGPAHFAFQREWITFAENGEYPFELSATLAHAFGGSTSEDWLTIAPTLSLLDQGVLDQACAPLLCVNGVNDTIFPIKDYYLLLEHGSPKDARFYQTGHMGTAPDTVPTMVAWLAPRLGV
ncbi:MAG: alpha/beta hydrolase [Chloroflexi bacterium]|nr:alpha/beta hydrolase [Chloroflexota bacterium]